jgi:2-C-methyl-D-erythritol 4-phosphate cytidylyltransferase
MRCAAIVVAGGSGQRFGGLKQFATLAGTTVAAHSIAACRAVADQVILVVPRGSNAEFHGADVVIEGGATRSASVRAGLEVIADSAEIIVIHDAARPLATERLFFSVVAELADEEIAGAIAGLPVTDTIKVVAHEGDRRSVVATPERSTLVAVQTPQAFRADAIRRAHREGDEATDDAALVEAVGGRVVVVPGEVENIKITDPRDLVMAEVALQERGR